MAVQLPIRQRQKRRHWFLETWYPRRRAIVQVRARRREQQHSHCVSRNLDQGFPRRNGQSGAPN